MLRIALFIIALTSGGVSAWLVSAMPASSPAEPVVQPVSTEDVLVATIDLDQGMQVAAEHLRWQPWPAEALNASFILRSKQPGAADELAGSILRGRVVAGEPIVPGKLSPAGSSFLSAVLSPGKRAVAIGISAEKTAGGFVLPNDRVDVMLTVACQPEDGCAGTMTVRTILRNVRVLAIDQSGSDKNSEGVLVGKTATLELDPVEAETLVGAEASGTLSLVLRSAADHLDQQSQVEESRTVRVWRSGVGEYVKLK